MKTFSEFINERVMSVTQRKKAARRMAKIARSPATQAKRKKAMLKMRNPAKLAMAARKKTIQSFRDKFYPSYGDMSLQQRVKIDQIIMVKYGKKIDKVAKKMAMVLKKKELERINAARAKLNA